jgi:alanine dehydrogenase
VTLLADKGWKQACKQRSDLKLGLNIINGQVVYKGVADAFQLPLEEVNRFL